MVSHRLSSPLLLMMLMLMLLLDDSYVSMLVLIVCVSNRVTKQKDETFPFVCLLLGWLMMMLSIYSALN